MDSSVQDNPAAPNPCHNTLKALLNSVLGYSNTNFAQPFLNRLLRVVLCPPSMKYQAACSQARLKSCWALPNLTDHLQYLHCGAAKQDVVKLSRMWQSSV
jgi:hypothetical protein